MSPEDQARLRIDELLTAAGWLLQDRAQYNRNAALGVAVRHFQLGKDEADYLLFVDGKATGVIEAKKLGVTLSGVSEQSEKYMTALPDYLAKWQETLVFDYESTGEETLFRDMRDPVPRSRRVFAFHRPETLLEWLEDDTSLRGRLAAITDPDGNWRGQDLYGLLVLLAPSEACQGEAGPVPGGPVQSGQPDSEGVSGL